MPRIAIAVVEGRGLDDRVAERFGRAPKFLIIDLDGEPRVVKVVENPGAEAHGGAAVKAIQVLVNEGVEVIVAPHFGPNAKAVISELGLKTVEVPAGTPVREAIEEVKRRLQA